MFKQFIIKVNYLWETNAMSLKLFILFILCVFFLINNKERDHFEKVKICFSWNRRAENIFKIYLAMWKLLKKFCWSDAIPDDQTAPRVSIVTSHPVTPFESVTFCTCHLKHQWPVGTSILLLRHCAEANKRVLFPVLTLRLVLLLFSTLPGQK